jgi:ribokinase
MEWARKVQAWFHTPILVIGMGGQGALLAVAADDYVSARPAVYTRPVLNTIGAGDALFSAFLHYYAQDRDPYTALHKAQIFASFKVGANGGAEGFLDDAGVAHWEQQARR